jgi:predicted ATPase with chaperone activity
MNELLSESSLNLPILEEETLPPVFYPTPAPTLKDLHIPYALIESLILKFIKVRGVAWGREISHQIKVPYRLMVEVLKQMKDDQLIGYRSSTGMHDYHYQLTAHGAERAIQDYQLSSYYGALPVSFSQYVLSTKLQSLDHQKPTPSALKESLRELNLCDLTFSQVGQAITSSRALFLYGAPGNGKTSITQRLCRTFGETIWIPRALLIHDQIVRLFDPAMHKEIDTPKTRDLDERWVQIERPTIIAGGELKMSDLEMQSITGTGLVESPLQLKSNCGILLIDDFGRQRMSTAELLNRWIMPMESRVDYLSMPNGNRICVPFNQMLVFSTNLKPKDLVDEAFLRRIPYKIHVPDPSPKQFYEVFKKVAGEIGMQFTKELVEYLLKVHYIDKKRPFRFCHPRDLLTQIKSYCEFHNQPLVLTQDSIDLVIKNYFVEE